MIFYKQIQAINVSFGEQIISKFSTKICLQWDGPEKFYFVLNLDMIECTKSSRNNYKWIQIYYCTITIWVEFMCIIACESSRIF